MNNLKHSDSSIFKEEQDYDLWLERSEEEINEVKENDN